jgi:ribosomal protein L29
MYVIHVTDAELETARHALRAYLSAFGHDEAETVSEIKRVIAKLNTAQSEGEEPRISA